MEGNRGQGAGLEGALLGTPHIHFYFSFFPTYSLSNCIL